MHIDRKPAEQIQVDWVLSVFIDKAHYQSFAVIGKFQVFPQPHPVLLESYR